MPFQLWPAQAPPLSFQFIAINHARTPDDSFDRHFLTLNGLRFNHLTKTQSGIVEGEPFRYQDVDVGALETLLDLQGQKVILEDAPCQPHRLAAMMIPVAQGKIHNGLCD
jgi:hypothetical protein